MGASLPPPMLSLRIGFSVYRNYFAHMAGHSGVRLLLPCGLFLSRNRPALTPME
jgi:hypothetical protein